MSSSSAGGVGVRASNGLATQVLGLASLPTPCRGPRSGALERGVDRVQRPNSLKELVSSVVTLRKRLAGAPAHRDEAEALLAPLQRFESLLRFGLAKRTVARSQRSVRNLSFGSTPGPKIFSRSTTCPLCAKKASATWRGPSIRTWPHDAWRSGANTAHNLRECRALDADCATTVTTNRCNRGSRSAWLDLQELSQLRPKLPALTELSEMLAGLPVELQAVAGTRLRMQPATMIAVYPEQAASYALHKDSYFPQDNDPATGATRRFTVLAYFNDWRPGKGGELRVHAPSDPNGARPDPKRFQALEPKAGTVVIFDSRKVWHADPSTDLGPRTLSATARTKRARVEKQTEACTVPRTNFREALKIHLADFQSRLIAEHESRLAPDLQSLELRIESLRAENERLRASMPEEPLLGRGRSAGAGVDEFSVGGSQEWAGKRLTDLKRSSGTLSLQKRSERPSLRDLLFARAEGGRERHHRGLRRFQTRRTRSSVRGSSVFDLRPLRPFPEDEPEKKVSESSNHQNQDSWPVHTVPVDALLVVVHYSSSSQDLVRAALAAWKEFTFNYVQDEDDESEQEIEALRQAAYKEWPEDLNGSEFWQAQLFRNELGRTMSSDLSASKEQFPEQCGTGIGGQHAWTC
eukprot:g16894.t1